MAAWQKDSGKVKGIQEEFERGKKLETSACPMVSASEDLKS